MWLAFTNNIQLLFLLAYTSHVLQPLDIAVFGPLKVKYRAWLNNCLSGLTSDFIAGK